MMVLTVSVSSGNSRSTILGYNMLGVPEMERLNIAFRKTTIEKRKGGKRDHYMTKDE